MHRRSFLSLAAAGALSALPVRAAQEVKKARPNILWLTCEDMSPLLGCYGCEEARTPHLDQLATEGAKFQRAFSVAGVCAPSRSCLITGRYPSAFGSNHMRCKRPLPASFHCFPYYLREAGYYCTNNVKTDYNLDAPGDTWDESSNKAHWRNRPSPEQPFFAVFNFMDTHESKIGTLTALDDATRPKPPHDPASLPLPPYYPDTGIVRRHWAHYFDLITTMDAWVGRHLRDLEQAGLAENTVVFFFSDHGTGLPCAKRWLWDRGLRVPLIVRWPGEVVPGSVREDLVSFVDFAPTVLSLAGVTPPAEMRGQVFLGPQQADARAYVYAARDRMDERYDTIRAVRDGRYKYIRNYEPERPYDQHLQYPESFPVMQEMRRMEREGKLAGPQKLFFQDRKALEELYDTDSDPNELNNLVEDADAADVLARMREALDHWMEQEGDLALLPEMELADWLAAPPQPVELEKPYDAPGGEEVGSAFGKSTRQWVADLNAPDPLVRLRAVRSLSFCGEAVRDVLLAALGDPQPSVAHWAARGLGAMPASEETSKALRGAVGHPAVSVRVAAALALCVSGERDTGLPTMVTTMNHENAFARLLAVEGVEHHGITSPEGIASLRNALTDQEPYVVRIAEHALEMICMH